jgi:hypothetical protein
MTYLKYFFAIMVTTSLPTLALAGHLRADHPLIGLWKVVVDQGACYELYEINAKGTSHVTSAEEISDSTNEIDDQPNSKGFYKWVDTIVSNNGKNDCSGEPTKIGDTATNYVKLSKSGESFIVCQDESMRGCFGPFIKQAIY